jgi:hypothetical protein
MEHEAIIFLSSSLPPTYICAIQLINSIDL